MDEASIRRLRDAANSLASLSYPHRVKICREAAKDLALIFKDHGFSDNEFAKFTLFLARLGVSADQLCGEVEHRFWEDAFGTKIDPERFYKLTNGGASQSFVRKMNDLIDNLSPKAKEDSCTIVMGFICADGVVSENEFGLLVRLFDYD